MKFNFLKGRNLLLEGLIIFLSVITSFSVQNVRLNKEKKDNLNEAIVTLGREISQNIDYSKEHLYQVKNLQYLTKKIVEDFSEIDLEEINLIHSENPFLHSIDINGDVTYIKQYGESTELIMFIGWMGWQPADVFFKSLLNSGALLEIENEDLRKEIESIYTIHQERVKGMSEFTLSISNDIEKWFIQNQNTFNYDIPFGDVFEIKKNQILKNHLRRKYNLLNQRISDIEFYIESLQNVISIIREEYVM